MPANATLPELTQRFHHQQLCATQFWLRPQGGRLFLRLPSGRFELRPLGVDSIRGGILAVYLNHES